MSSDCKNLSKHSVRSGKSSITNVIFHKLHPSETLHLETTTHITKDAMQWVIRDLDFSSS